MSQVKQLLADTHTPAVKRPKKITLPSATCECLEYLHPQPSNSYLEMCPYTDQAAVKSVSFRGKSPFRGDILHKPGLFQHLQKL